MTALQHDPLCHSTGCRWAAAVLISAASLGHRYAGLKFEDKDKATGRISPVDLLPLAGTSAGNHWNMLTGVTPGQCSNIDPILRDMLASSHGICPASLLSPRPAFPRVSRDLLR